jgi:HK97 family phage major capsid protein
MQESSRLTKIRKNIADSKNEFMKLAKHERLTQPQNLRWDELSDEIAELESVEAELVERTLGAERAAAVLDPDRGRDPSHHASAERDAALRHIESNALPIEDSIREAATNFVEHDDSGNTARIASATADPNYFRAFMKMFADPERGHLLWNVQEADAWRRVHTLDNELERAMTATTGSSGGFMVPFTLDPTIIITGTGSINPFRQIANLKQTATPYWHGVTAAQVSAAYAGENVAVGDNTPTLTQPTIQVWKGTAYVPASFEAFEDVLDLANQVGELFADAKDNLEANKFTLGSGVNEPKGIVTAINAVTASRVAPATAGAFALPDIYSTQNALPPRFSRNAKWISSLPIINRMRRFGEGTTGSMSAYWQDLGGATPPELLGRELYEVSDMSSNVAAGQDILCYGDFRKFVIADHVGGAHAEFIPNVMDATTGRPLGQRAWLLWWRHGSDVTDANAFRLLHL